MTEQTTFTLNKDQIDNLTKWIRTNTSSLVFRRVHYVNTNDDNLIGSEEIYLDDKNNISKRWYNKATIPQGDKYIEEYFTPHYKTYFGFTKNNVLIKETDPASHEAIFLHSGSCCFFDAPNMCLIPRTHRKDKAPKVPLVKISDKYGKNGDIVAGLVEKTDKGWKYSQWFICSEQFMTMWSLVMFPSHELFKDKSDEQLQKDVVNTEMLITNMFKHWKDSYSDSNVLMKDMKKYMRTLRYEKGAKENCHIYVALVLMTRWGILPTEDNIPNLDQKIKNNAWDLPDGWLQWILQTVVKLEM